jgi:hypothetical protein
VFKKRKKCEKTEKCGFVCVGEEKGKQPKKERKRNCHIISSATKGL